MVVVGEILHLCLLWFSGGNPTTELLVLLFYMFVYSGSEVDIQPLNC